MAGEAAKGPGGAPLPWGRAQLERFMRQRGIQGEFVHPGAPTPTVASAALAVGATPDQILKTLLFLIRGEPVLAIASGQGYVDRAKLAAEYGVGKKQVKLAGVAQVLEITGYPVGAVPPFGHLSPLRTLIDPGVMELKIVYAGGGEIDCLLRTSPEEILRATRGKILALQREEA